MISKLQTIFYLWVPLSIANAGLIFLEKLGLFNLSTTYLFGSTGLTIVFAVFYAICEEFNQI